MHACREESLQGSFAAVNAPPIGTAACEDDSCHRNECAVVAGFERPQCIAPAPLPAHQISYRVCDAIGHKTANLSAVQRLIPYNPEEVIRMMKKEQGIAQLVSE